MTSDQKFYHNDTLWNHYICRALKSRDARCIENGIAQRTKHRNGVLPSSLIRDGVRRSGGAFINNHGGTVLLFNLVGEMRVDWEHHSPTEYESFMLNEIVNSLILVLQGADDNLLTEYLEELP